MCKVSVIMPSLNVAKYIRQCIESVMSQTLGDIEIICVDAGSTDGTAEILKECASKDSRIILLHSDVKSYGHQMNIGIQKASGEYIGVVETDDYVENNMFERLYTVAKKNNADIAKGAMYINYEYDNFKSIEMFGDYLDSNAGIENTLIDPSDNPNVFLYNSNLWNGIYKRDFLVTNKILFNETPGAAYQDIGFHHQIFNYAHRVVYIRNYLYHYRVLREGSSSCNDKILRNVYQEYKWLWDSGRLKCYSGNFFFKMAVDAIGEYKRLLQYYDFDCSKIKDSEMLPWFRNEILTLKSNNLFLGSDIERDLYLFLLGNGWLENEYKEKVSAIKKWYDSFYENASKNGVVLFGVGNYGKFLAPFLIRNGLPPVTYTDNDEASWGTKFSLPVNSSFIIQKPSAVIENFPKSTYLVASKNFGEDIKNQLLSADIKEKNIVVYDGQDQILQRALAVVPYLITRE